MKKVLVFVQTKEEHPELTKPQLCKMIGISDSSPKRNMKNLNMKSFYRHEAPVNKMKSDLPVNKKNKKGHISTKKISPKGRFVYQKGIEADYRSDKAPIINYDDMLSNYLVRD